MCTQPLFLAIDQPTKGGGLQSGPGRLSPPVSLRHHGNTQDHPVQHYRSLSSVYFHFSLTFYFHFSLSISLTFPVILCACVTGVIDISQPLDIQKCPRNLQLSLISSVFCSSSLAKTSLVGSRSQLDSLPQCVSIGISSIKAEIIVVTAYTTVCHDVHKH